MEFKANYFDGQSSKTHQAIVTPNPSGWRIVFNNTTETTKEVIWKIDTIQKSEVYTQGLIAFTYGKEFPFQKIESTDPNFIAYISKSDHKNLNNKLDTTLHKSVNKSIAILLAVIVGFALGMYFYVIPTVAVSFAKNLNKEHVIDFGDYIFRTISLDLDIDEKQSEKLQDFVDAMQIDCEFPIQAKVANSSQLNAFAVSGGKIVIFSSLLEKIQNEHQLAALIGHEVSHVQNRHVLKNVARNLSGAIFVSVLFGDINGVTAIIGENAHLFSQLSYTRSLEKEADIFGIEIMRANNLDLNGMPQLFQILKDESEVDIPTYLSNHPMLKDRIVYTQEIADQQSNTINNTVLKEKWNKIAAGFTNTIENNDTDDIIDVTDE